MCQKKEADSSNAIIQLHASVFTDLSWSPYGDGSLERLCIASYTYGLSYTTAEMLHRTCFSRTDFCPSRYSVIHDRQQLAHCFILCCRNSIMHIPKISDCPRAKTGFIDPCSSDWSVMQSYRRNIIELLSWRNYLSIYHCESEVFFLSLCLSVRLESLYPLNVRAVVTK